MGRKKNTVTLPFDFHSHILPGMDDGAKNVEISIAQLETLSDQGIRRVVATPHMYLHRQGLDAFLTRRHECARALRLAVSQSDKPLPDVSMGAEVYLERGLLQVDLPRLCMADTDYVLFELPHNGAEENDIELIFNLCTRNGVRPMIAHLDRYLDILSELVLDMIFSLEDVVIQINNDACSNRRRAKFILKLLRDGVPVVFGSDTHNMTDRSPNFDLIHKFLASKLKEDAFRELKLQQIALLTAKF